MALEGTYDFRGAEPRLLQRWTDLGIYRFEPSGEGPIFSVDTPPPTVSGRIHIGHVYSYTQADIAIRFRRMRGARVFYPFGFDDNGLPTERFAEATYGITARQVGRTAFVEACLRLSAEVEGRFERFWQRLGLSVDWRLKYSTIDPRARRIAQASFVDLARRGLATRREAPALWCPLDRTAVAQADVEDREGVPSTFVTVDWQTSAGRAIPIATTRPELLPACVAVFVHPDDPRYMDLIGAVATVPLFGLEVPILANPEADPEKGSGAVMCCTFGDVSDVRWWYTYRLPLRIAVNEDGTMNALAGVYAGLPIAEARARVIADLQERGLVSALQPIEHTIGVHDRCGTPIEYLVAPQWFVEVLSQRERLLEAGRQIAWYPSYMQARYESWVQGLSWDWNISRQRVYGVPFPVWYCERCGEVALADPAQLPLDPAESVPPGACPSCGGASFRPETDVMDTWAISSLTPRILASLAGEVGVPEQEFRARCSPMSLRPNAHDIIRTWDFYTIVRSLHDGGAIPWHALMIAGHATQDGGKISKSKQGGSGGKGNIPLAAQDPSELIETYSADALRYWTASVRMGGDTPVSAEAFRQGNRLVTKLWNAARFVLQYEDVPEPDAGRDRPDTSVSGRDERFAASVSVSGRTLDAGVPALLPSDRWVLHRLGQAIAQSTAALEQYELSTARAAVERFFWSDFCDTYLELVKFRLNRRGAEPGTDLDAGRAAAIRTLRVALLATLKLLAPFLPFVTEEVYVQTFAAEEGMPSIHRSAWPDAAAFPRDPAIEALGETLLAVIDEVRRWKSGHKLSVGAPLAALSVVCPADQAPLLGAMVQDLRSITRAEAVQVAPGEGVSVRVHVT